MPTRVPVPRFDDVTPQFDTKGGRMVPVTTFVVVAAFVATVAAAMGKAPLWVGVLLAVVALMLQVLPR
jgi:hypothetical protein